MAEQADKTKAKYELKKQLERLREMKGSGTELISVYIPANQPVHEMSNKLREEAGQAQNIKSKSTRKNVGDALERILHHLKTYGNTVPESGVAIFCGNVSDNPAKVDIELFTVYPPEPINVQIYRCDSRFFLEPLERMLAASESYGIVVLDGRECTLAELKGTTVRILHRLNSTAHAKIRKGGQSARRYERLIEESIELYYKRIGESMDRYFLNSVKGVIIGGPGPAKDNFVKMSPFNYQIKILGVVDTGYTDEYGVREVMAKSEGIIAEQEAIKERILVERFIKEVVSGGLAAYGESEVRKALESRQASLLLVSEGLGYKRAKLVDSATGKEHFVTSKSPSELEEKIKSIGGNLRLESEKPLLDDLIELAEKMGVEVVVVSADTAEGAQFLGSFYGIGAFLRYR
ncbi:MAG: peptide chain release factor aRF-1 [Candidatus Micrarchaeota archaeon]|nr:peptide chain release factor aRF-1 [Candidatus Micrarchaeota archaeon]